MSTKQILERVIPRCEEAGADVVALTANIFTENPEWAKLGQKIKMYE